MVSALRQSASLYVVLLLLMTVMFVNGGAAHAEPRPLTQSRINELAALLLRGRWALVEEPGLRRADEQLAAYMDRLAAPLPGEDESRSRRREEGYISALDRALSPRNLCTALPALHDSSAANVEIWTRAVRASAQLPAEVARLHAEWSAEERLRPAARRPWQLGAHFTRTLLLIKAAYEALREARP